MYREKSKKTSTESQIARKNEQQRKWRAEMKQNPAWRLQRNERQKEYRRRYKAQGKKYIRKREGKGQKKQSSDPNLERTNGQPTGTWVAHPASVLQDPPQSSDDRSSSNSDWKEWQELHQMWHKDRPESSKAAQQRAEGTTSGSKRGRSRSKSTQRHSSADSDMKDWQEIHRMWHGNRPETPKTPQQQAKKTEGTKAASKTPKTPQTQRVKEKEESGRQSPSSEASLAEWKNLAEMWHRS